MRERLFGYQQEHIRQLENFTPQMLLAVLPSIETPPINADLYFSLEEDRKENYEARLKLKMERLRNKDYRKWFQEYADLIESGMRYTDIEILISESRKFRGKGFEDFKDVLLPVLTRNNFLPVHVFIVLDSPKRRARGFETTYLQYGNGDLTLHFQDRKLDSKKKEQILKWWEIAIESRTAA